MLKNPFIRRSFAISLLFCLFLPYFFPFFHLNYFAPFLCKVARLVPLHQGVWIAFICGFILDSMNYTFTFGAFSLSYVVCLFLIYRIKHFFFDDKAFSFALLVTVFSFCFSLLEIGVFSINHKSFSLSFLSILSQVILMPMVDGLYGFLWARLPSEAKKRSKQLQTLFQAYKLKRNQRKST